MPLQSFDATTLTDKKKKTWLRMKKQGACKCVCMSSSSLNIYILMWVTVSCGPENKYDTRRGVSWVSSVIWFCRVSHCAVNEEKQHQSPCPPTLSLGMMRSSEPCFRNTFPATQDRERHIKITVCHLRTLIRGFTVNKADTLQTTCQLTSWERNLDFSSQ